MLQFKSIVTMLQFKSIVFKPKRWYNQSYEQHIKGREFYEI